MSAARAGLRLATLVLCPAVLACGGEGGTGPSGPAPVALVSVTLATPSVVVGGSVQGAAVVRDADGNVLTDRTVTWSTSNGAVATVSGAGTVTTIAPGNVTITATAEGKSGQAPLQVTQPPVAEVTIFGTARVKVGDQYSYTVQARLANGTVVQRPIAWSIVESGKASISASGVAVPLQTGTITLRAIVDGVVGLGQLTAYDWSDTGPGATRVIYLPADNTITNKFGTAEYPTLGIGCTSGVFLMYVSTDNFVTQSGQVAYSFDGGLVVSQTWLEFSSFSSLGHPGPTNLATKNFALQMTGARAFGFGFTEFNASAKAMIFRVTGLSAALQPILSACPGNALVENTDTRPWYERLPDVLRPLAPMTPDRQLRLQQGALLGRSRGR